MPYYLFIWFKSFPFLIINIISNDFLTINQSNKFSKYINLGDPIAVSGSMDPVLGSIDLFLLLYPLLIYYQELNPPLYSPATSSSH